MILGMGIDVVATDRVARLLEGDTGFEVRLFTPTEREACRTREDRAAALGARFAAKEACLKALGTGWGSGVSPADVEVRTLDGGRPELALSAGAGRRAAALGVTRIHVSLSHDVGVVAAVVVLEGEISPLA